MSINFAVSSAGARNTNLFTLCRNLGQHNLNELRRFKSWDKLRENYPSSVDLNFKLTPEMCNCIREYIDSGIIFSPITSVFHWINIFKSAIPEFFENGNKYTLNVLLSNIRGEKGQFNIKSIITNYEGRNLAHFNTKNEITQTSLRGLTKFSSENPEIACNYRYTLLVDKLPCNIESSANSESVKNNLVHHTINYGDNYCTLQGDLTMPKGILSKLRNLRELYMNPTNVTHYGDPLYCPSSPLRTTEPPHNKSNVTFK